jgi:hypothetical protein
MRAALERIVQHHDVAGLHPHGVYCGAHRERHGAQVHGHVVALRDRLAVGVVDGARVVQPLLDVRGKPRAAQRDPHFLGNREEDVLEDLEFDRISAHRSRS